MKLTNELKAVIERARVRLANDGTSEGAKKGWETRRAGGAVAADGADVGSGGVDFERHKERVLGRLSKFDRDTVEKLWKRIEGRVRKAKNIMDIPQALRSLYVHPRFRKALTALAKPFQDDLDRKYEHAWKYGE